MKKTISAAVFAVAMGFVSVNSFAGITMIGQDSGVIAQTSGRAIAGGITGSTASVRNFEFDLSGTRRAPNVYVSGESVRASSGTVAGAASLRGGDAYVNAGAGQTVINGNGH